MTAGQNSILNFAVSPSSTGSISGTIRDSLTEYPLEGMTVTASPGGQSAVTDTDGYYFISDLSPATYDLTASATGYYSTVCRDITVQAGETAAASFYTGPGVPLSGNMLSNTDMEQTGSIPGVALGWETPNAQSSTSFSIDTSVRFTGRQSQKICPNGSWLNWLGQFTSYSAIRTGTKYRIQCWVKTSNVTGGEAKLVGTYFTNAAIGIGELQAYPKLTTTNGWTLLEGIGTAPSFLGENVGRMRLEITAPSASGTAWFDQAYLGVYYGSESPVCTVRNFTATPGSGTVTLSWTNPPSSPFSSFTGTTIRYRTDRYPVTPTDGYLAGEVPGTPGGTSSFTHTGVTSGIHYYYGAFAHTSNYHNYSQGSYTSTFPMDGSPPTTPVVTDDGNYTRSSDTLHASWTADDPESGIEEYQYAIGTTRETTDVVAWTSAGTANEVTRTGLSLTNGSRYFVMVKAKNPLGYWSAVGISDGIKAVAPAQTIAEAKLLPDGTFVWLEDKIVSADNSDLTDMLYVQEQDRSSGIRVVATSGAHRGDLADVSGLLCGGSLERMISPALVTYQSFGDPPRSLGMSLRSLLGGNLCFQAGPPASGQTGLSTEIGPNNVGLLATVWGRVTQIGSDYFYIDDGSGITDGTQTGDSDNIGVRVEWDPDGHTSGDFVMVTGIVSCFESQAGTIARLVLPRDSADVATFSSP